jgi:hypothetical protein
LNSVESSSATLSSPVRPCLRVRRRSAAAMISPHPTALMRMIRREVKSIWPSRYPREVTFLAATEYLGCGACAASGAAHGRLTHLSVRSDGQADSNCLLVPDCDSCAAAGRYSRAPPCSSSRPKASTATALSTARSMIRGSRPRRPPTSASWATAGCIYWP